MKHIYYLLFLLISANAQAYHIKGKVWDAVTGDPMVGATVHIKGTQYSSFVDLDGSYIIKNITPGSYTLVASFVSYKAVERIITVSDKDVTADFIMSENVTQLQEITVSTAAETGSDAHSRKIEQNSDNVVSVIGSKAIQLLPDVTVGNLMQRVSGVSIVRNGNGDGQYAVIRGMDQRYNYTTVNGIKIPSPDNKNRYIPMDIFPAELLERLEVVKALTPGMEGDAIGGAMNMAMKSAPASFNVQANISGGYSSIISTNPFKTFNAHKLQFKAPSEIHGNSYKSVVSDYSIDQLKYRTVNFPVNSTYGLTIGNRFFKKKQLGVVFAGSYQNLYRSHTGIFYNISGQPNPGNVVSNDGIENRFYSSLQGRTGLHINIDYNLGSKTKFNLYNIFAQLDETQYRRREEIRTTDVGEYSNHDRSMFQRQRVNSTTFKIEQIIFRGFKANLSLNSSFATNIIPDQVELDVKTKVDKNTTTGQLTDPGYYINSLTHKWYHNSDKDKGAYLNLTYAIIPAIEIATGGLYKKKDKDNFFTENTLNAFGATSAGQLYNGIDNVVFMFKPESNAYADSTDGKNYVAKEEIKAAYIQSKVVLFKKLQILGGVRAERTLQSYTSAISVYSPGKIGSVTYLDYLPSVHLKYELNKKSNLRLSYFKGISRPALYEFILAPNVGDYYTETGNPLLKHTKSINYDLRYELFMSGDEQFLAGFFYKTIVNPIEYSFTQILSNQYYYAPTNFGTATNYGFEAVFSKFYKKFGISGNYTYTQSSITTLKRTIEANGVPGSREVTRPLQGQSKHVANVSFIYKNSKLGLDLRLSWVYTGERINVVSAYYGLDYWQRPTSQLDFSGEKKIGKRFTVYAKITNLLSSSTIVEIRTPLPDYFVGDPGQSRSDRVLVSKDVFGQMYLAGLRYKL